VHGVSDRGGGNKRDGGVAHAPAPGIATAGHAPEGVLRAIGGYRALPVIADPSASAELEIAKFRDPRARGTAGILAALAPTLAPAPARGGLCDAQLSRDTSGPLQRE